MGLRTLSLGLSSIEELLSSTVGLTPKKMKKKKNEENAGDGLEL